MTKRTSIRRAARLAREAALETLWPTRCAVCDRPGSLVCDECLRNLSYLDQWQACPRCGAAYGRVQCTECNPVMMRSSGVGEPPFESCTSALMFSAKSARIARAFKDYGELRMAPVMARLMGNALMPEWKEECEAVTFIPATDGARLRRGFDHGELLARELAQICGLPCLALLAPPQSSDQRGLSRSERFANMTRVFAGNGEGAAPSMAVPKRVLLADDVMTTGATLFAAANALKRMGAQQVRCVTFARV